MNSLLKVMFMINISIIVFKVLDSKSGDVIETIKHKSLENLKYDDDRIEILSSVSNQQ